MDQRSRLIHGTERLQDGSRRLEEAQRVALETGIQKKKEFSFILCREYWNKYIGRFKSTKGTNVED